jgi:hypothetical protein
MKNVLNLFIKIIFLFSFTLIKAQNEPINDYLETLNLKENEKIMIIREKINNNITIDIFRKNIYLDPIQNENLRQLKWSKIYNDKDWVIMKKKYEEDFVTDYWVKGNYWTLNDFKHKNILFWKQEKLPNLGKYEKFDFDENYKLFSFSAPIFYKNKLYAIFTFIESNTRYLQLGPANVIVMKKIKNKWVWFQSIHDGIYN